MTPFDVAPYIVIGGPLLGILATIGREAHRASREQHRASREHAAVPHAEPSPADAPRADERDERDAYEDFTARDGMTVTISRRPDLYLVGGRVIHAEHRFAARRFAASGPPDGYAA